MTYPRKQNNGCEICESLVYDKGVYSCKRGVNFQEYMKGSGDFENKCINFKEDTRLVSQMVSGLSAQMTPDYQKQQTSRQTKGQKHE